MVIKILQTTYRRYALISHKLFFTDTFYTCMLHQNLVQYVIIISNKLCRDINISITRLANMSKDEYSNSGVIFWYGIYVSNFEYFAIKILEYPPPLFSILQK